MSDTKTMSEGQWRVGVSFNPGKLPEVDQIKTMVAEVIDYIFVHGKDDRCTALAATAFEEAAMWAVKSVTKTPKDE